MSGEYPRKGNATSFLALAIALFVFAFTGHLPAQPKKGETRGWWPQDYSVSRAGEAYVLLANLEANPKKVRCRIDTEKLPVALKAATSAEIPGKDAAQLVAAKLTGDGEDITIPADDVVMIHIR